MRDSHWRYCVHIRGTKDIFDKLHLCHAGCSLRIGDIPSVSRNCWLWCRQSNDDFILSEDHSKITLIPTTKAYVISNRVLDH